MSKASRPSLDSLSSRFARKDPALTAADPAVSPATEVAPAAEPAFGTGRPVKTKADNRVQVLTRIDPAIRKRLKLIAADQERTIQEICEEAIRDFVARHSK